MWLERGPCKDRVCLVLAQVSPHLEEGLLCVSLLSHHRYYTGTRQEIAAFHIQRKDLQRCLEPLRWRHSNNRLETPCSQSGQKPSTSRQFTILVHQLRLYGVKRQEAYRCFEHGAYNKRGTARVYTANAFRCDDLPNHAERIPGCSWDGAELASCLGILEWILRRSQCCHEYSLLDRSVLCMLLRHRRRCRRKQATPRE